VLSAGTVDGANLQLDNAGSPEQAKVRGATVAGLGVNVICAIATWPFFTATAARVGAMLKSGFATTAKDCGTLPGECRQHAGRLTVSSRDFVPGRSLPSLGRYLVASLSRDRLGEGGASGYRLPAHPYKISPVPYAKP
jgi:hypothetical protein